MRCFGPTQVNHIGLLALVSTTQRRPTPVVGGQKEGDCCQPDSTASRPPTGAVESQRVRERHQRRRCVTPSRPPRPPGRAFRAPGLIPTMSRRTAVKIVAFRMNVAPSSIEKPEGVVPVLQVSDPIRLAVTRPQSLPEGAQRCARALWLLRWLVLANIQPLSGRLVGRLTCSVVVLEETEQAMLGHPTSAAQPQSGRYHPTRC